MMKTSVVLVCAAEFDKDSKSLTSLGELQVERFAEAMRVKGVHPTCYLAAGCECDSWTTAYHLKEALVGPEVQTLRDLSIGDLSVPRNVQIQSLIERFPHWPLSTCVGESGYHALLSHSKLALREIRRHIVPTQPQQILICSRRSHVLSALAFDWVSEMIFAGFKLCPHAGLPAFPVDTGDLCYSATEFFLEPGQGLFFRYDVSEPSQYMTSSIQYVNPEAFAR